MNEIINAFTNIETQRYERERLNAELLEILKEILPVFEESAMFNKNKYEMMLSTKARAIIRKAERNQAS